ncbi:MAG: hydroxymethylglutaryl-CoA lyase [Bdellovibrio sp.]|nr:MAG: hydroxymethylglutaryl-CoA lyase [Bdellovibrio sp.]
MTRVKGRRTGRRAPAHGRPPIARPPTKKARVEIVEVALRDGLQNEAAIVSLEDRVKIAEQLIIAGVKRLELGAFVRADRVPQMAGTKELVKRVYQDLGLSSSKQSAVCPSALVPNLRGFEEAMQTPIGEIAVFTAASESFAKANINCSIEESFERFIPVIKAAKQKGLRVRGYLSTCFGCPYEGEVDEKKVVELASRLLRMGCFEISIGDTIGVATPKQVISLFRRLKRKIPIRRLAGHFHDTRGTALANIFAAHGLGVRVFDSSLGGLGGCPYAPSASGNVSTEDVVYMFHGMGVETGIDLRKLVELSRLLGGMVGKLLQSRTGQAGLPKVSRLNS